MLSLHQQLVNKVEFGVLIFIKHDVLVSLRHCILLSMLRNHLEVESLFYLIGCRRNPQWMDRLLRRKHVLNPFCLLERLLTQSAYFPFLLFPVSIFLLFLQHALVGCCDGLAGQPHIIIIDKQILVWGCNQL